MLIACLLFCLALQEMLYNRLVQLRQADPEQRRTQVRPRLLLVYPGNGCDNLPARVKLTRPRGYH